ncbi:hypothetical protein D9M68_796540 [compost metagenome]
MLLLFLGAAGEQGTREDLRASDQTTGGRQRGFGQCLGDHDHGQGFILALHRAAAVLFRNRQTEYPHLAQCAEQIVWHNQVMAMDSLSQGRYDIGGEAAELVLDQ